MLLHYIIYYESHTYIIYQYYTMYIMYTIPADQYSRTRAAKAVRIRDGGACGGADPSASRARDKAPARARRAGAGGCTASGQYTYSAHHMYESNGTKLKSTSRP